MSPYATFYSILFFPSSKPSSRASLLPRSCFVPTKGPTTELCETFESVSWNASICAGWRLSLGQLTYKSISKGACNLLPKELMTYVECTVAPNEVEAYARYD